MTLCIVYRYRNSLEGTMSEGQEIARCVERVIEHIPAVARRLGIDANGGWTLLIKNQLAQLGDELDYQVCASGAARANADCHPDWIYDLIWLEMAKGGTEVARVPLVLESEWHSNREEQRDDFQELLSAPADVHVLVFQQRKAAGVQAVMDELERQAKACGAAGRGELCMLCGYDWEDTQRFAFRNLRDLKTAAVCSEGSVPTAIQCVVHRLNEAWE